MGQKTTAWIETKLQKNRYRKSYTVFSLKWADWQTYSQGLFTYPWIGRLPTS